MGFLIIIVLFQFTTDSAGERILKIG